MAKALVSLVADDGLSARLAVDKFIDFARKNNIHDQWRHILGGLEEECRARGRRRKVVIETAQLTSAATTASLLKFVAAPIDGLVETKVNPEIIGGFRIYSQGQLFDASFQNSLVRLKQSLAENVQ